MAHLDELSDHSGALSGTGPRQGRYTLSNGAIGLLVRQRGTLGVNRTRQHPKQVHVTQTGRVSSHQSLKIQKQCSCFLVAGTSCLSGTWYLWLKAALYLVEVQHGGQRSTLQQRGPDQCDELREDVPSTQLAQRGRVGHRQRGQEAQRHLGYVHVTL